VRIEPPERPLGRGRSVRFLFSVQPAASHLQPLVPVGRELLNRGHEVAIVCSRPFCGVVREFGFKAIPAGLDWLRAEAEKFFPQLRPLPSQERYGWILSNVYGDRAARRLIPELLDLCASLRPDVVLRDQMEFASWLVAEKLNIPHVSYGYGLGFLEADQKIVGPKLSQLRSELNLLPDDNLSTIFRHLRLEFAPRSYLGKATNGPCVTHFIRARINDCPSNTPSPDWIGHLGRRPVVVATLGNTYNRTPGIFETIIAALAREPIDLILMIGRNRRREDFGRVPANVRIEQYVPLSLLLPHADVTICHAGYNTIFTSVAAGTPLVLIPIDSDQPAGALRCTQLGLGLRLDSRQLRLDDLRDAVRQVLVDARYRRAVADFRRELEALPGAAHAASLLESVATRGMVAV
jgi:UDP:flavonoid glycosyltransferase YjiC (YdhE family)